MKKLFAALIGILFLMSIGWGYASETTKVNLKGKNSIKHFKLTIDNSRAVVLKDEVEQFNVDAIVTKIKDFAKENNHPIFMIINSPGGSVEAGLELMNTMKSVHVPIYCAIETEAFSMAADISQYCTKTYIHKYATMMFHQASYAVSGKADQIEIRVAFTGRYLKAIEKDLASQMGITYEQFLNKRGVEWWVVADEAAQFGLVDGVLDELYYTVKPPDKPFGLFLFNMDYPDNGNTIKNPVK